MPTPDAAAAAARFLVVRRLPLLVVDLESPDRDVPVHLVGGLFTTLVERGLVVLPRFYGVELPRGVAVGFRLTADELTLEDRSETRLLRVPRAGVDPAWASESLRLKGTMLAVGRDLELDADLDDRAVCDVLEIAAAQERVAGAIVGVAEERQGLPIIGLN